MKFRTSLFIAMLLVTGAVSAADDAEKKYSSEIEQVKYIINHSQDENFDVEIGVGVAELSNAIGKDKAMEQVGYLVKDISGDGVPELLIGMMSKNNEPDSYCKGNQIFMIYTLADNKPVLVTEGWGRSLSCTMPGDQFFFSGSGGAAVSLVGKYSLSYDGTAQSWTEFYYTYPDENSPEMEVNFYRNKTGELDPDTSEKLKIDYDKYEKIGDSWSKLTAPWDEFKPISQYGKAVSSSANSNCPNSSEIVVDFVPKNLLKLGAYEQIKIATSEPSVNVSISPKGKVTDFKFLGLEFLSADDDGNIKFNEKTLYTADEIVCGKTIVFNINMIGSIPNNGISFKDASGKVKKFTISQSGKDGSLILSEFK